MKYKRNVYGALTMITQFTINMLVPIALCSALGYYLDQKLGTNWIVIVLFFVGAAAGARNVYVFAMKVVHSSSDDRNRDHAKGIPSDGIYVGAEHFLTEMDSEEGDSHGEA